MKKGFTLIELMVVVAIIAFLAMISVPSFKRYFAKAKRSEAYMHLHALATAQKVYWAEHGKYTPDLAALDWHPEGTLHYTYSVQSATGAATDAASGNGTFTMLATGDIDGDGYDDVISIDQNMNCVIVQDDILQ